MTPEESAVVAVQVAALDRKLDAFREEVKEDITEIKTQTKRTNGRVTTAEKQIAMVKGAIAVLTLSTPFLLFALGRLLGGA